MHVEWWVDPAGIRFRTGLKKSGRGQKFRGEGCPLPGSDTLEVRRGYFNVPQWKPFPTLFQNEAYLGIHLVPPFFMLVCNRRSIGIWRAHDSDSALGLLQTFYSLLASWASPYFSSLNLVIARQTHIFRHRSSHSWASPFFPGTVFSLTLSYWVSR
jgi:hypothetical protein